MTDPFQINMRHLRGVSAIVATKRVVAAACEVGLSQPALTQGLSRLERHMGARLFQRHPQGMMPTVIGSLVAQESDSIFADLADGLRQRIPSGRGFSEPEKLITMTQVRSMIALADTGSFVMASAHSGLSPSAICRAVHDLGQLVGIPFAERKGRGVAITEAGYRATKAFRLAVETLQSVLIEVERTSAERFVGPLPGGSRLAGPRPTPIARRDQTLHLRLTDVFVGHTARRMGRSLDIPRLHAHG